MGLLDWLTKGSDPAVQAAKEASARRQTDIQASLRAHRVPTSIAERLQGAKNGTLPWIATLSPAELLITRSHGLKPIAAVSATCWMQYGWSWTQGHWQGWEAALRRLREEAKAAGANAVVDVKMRSISLDIEDSMDFTLIGTAVRIDGLPPSVDPVIATVPALEFVKLLEADVIPTGIAIGAHYEWMTDWRGNATMSWMGNTESKALSQLWETVRQRAHAQLRDSARPQGNGVLAHVNFSQMFEREIDKQPNQYLARHIVVATVVDAKRDRQVNNTLTPGLSKQRATTVAQYRGTPIPHEFRMVVDMHAGSTPLTGTTQHHQSYYSNDEDGAI
jgi:Putative heavy-metal-binding